MSPVALRCDKLFKQILLRPDAQSARTQYVRHGVDLGLGNIG